MKITYKNKLLKLHSAGLILFIALAWLISKLAGCEEYGLTNCGQKEIITYVFFVVIGLVPIICSIYINRITYILIFAYDILISILLFPVGTAIGVYSIMLLLEYKKCITNGPS